MPRQKETDKLTKENPFTNVFEISFGKLENSLPFWQLSIGFSPQLKNSESVRSGIFSDDDLEKSLQSISYVILAE